MEKRTMVFVMFFALIATVFFSFGSAKIIGDITGKAIYSAPPEESAASGIYVILAIFLVAVLAAVAYYIRKGKMIGAAKEMNELNRKWWPVEMRPPYGN